MTLGVLAGIVLTFFGFRAVQDFGYSGRAKETLGAPAVVSAIRQLNELVAVKYTVQRVVGLEEKKVPLGEERLLLFVQADVLAGVDLSVLTPAAVSVSGDRVVRIDLPAPKITDVVIDDKQTKVWDRSITWWTPWVPYNPDLERQARLTARDEIEKAALATGILDQARRNAESSIRNFLALLGFKLVSFGDS
jgi:hypothetical protein